MVRRVEVLGGREDLVLEAARIRERGLLRPLERFRGWLRDNANMTDEDEEEITGSVKKLLNDALKRAEESPLPEPASLESEVFASVEDLDTPHHK